MPQIITSNLKLDTYHEVIILRVLVKLVVCVVIP
jgi:hypothetical protein